jgi:hypothetical protein
MAPVVLCYLLTVLWVRSYWWRDDAWRIDAGGSTIRLMSNQGTASIIRAPFPAGGVTSAWQIRSYQIAPASSQSRLPRLASGFQWNRGSGRISVDVPFYQLVVVSGILAVPAVMHLWKQRPLRINFSLRALLAATAFVAVLLGLIVAATR